MERGDARRGVTRSACQGSTTSPCKAAACRTRVSDAPKSCGRLRTALSSACPVHGRVLDRVGEAWSIGAACPLRNLASPTVTPCPVPLRRCSTRRLTPAERALAEWIATTSSQGVLTAGPGRAWCEPRGGRARPGPVDHHRGAHRHAPKRLNDALSLSTRRASNALKLLAEAQEPLLQGGAAGIPGRPLDLPAMN